MRYKDLAQIEHLIKKNKFPYWKLFYKDKTRRIPVMSFMTLKPSDTAEEDFIEESIEALKEMVETDPQEVFSIELLKNPKSSKDSRMGYFDFVVEDFEEEEEELKGTPTALPQMGMPTQMYSMFMAQIQNMLEMQKNAFSSLLDVKEKTHKAEMETLLGRVKSDMENVQTRWELGLREKELEAKERNLKEGKKSGGMVEELLAGVLSGLNQPQQPQPTQTAILSGTSENIPVWYQSLNSEQRQKIDKVLGDENTKNYLLDLLNKM